ncbi:hypothetical protein TSOC_009748 [Tetrabaena socialis]|uniref:Protein kinase domain-containing protein n=1 Tax=Tetrabaena socialis TaxID=47790 RepID=A0A2J7ZV39_9CHLO|nr:hypothetical protein TSOC_009748 [Tetrabaena socialis]|eukprot:PNH04120.1 hypothetical protein TSOC_009748 [Tetrabaena socialis]
MVFGGCFGRRVFAATHESKPRSAAPSPSGRPAEPVSPVERGPLPAAAARELQGSSEAEAEDEANLVQRLRDSALDTLRVGESPRPDKMGSWASPPPSSTLPVFASAAGRVAAPAPAPAASNNRRSIGTRGSVDLQAGARPAATGAAPVPAPVVHNLPRPFACVSEPALSDGGDSEGGGGDDNAAGPWVPAPKRAPVMAPILLVDEQQHQHAGHSTQGNAELGEFCESLLLSMQIRYQVDAELGTFRMMPFPDSRRHDAPMSLTFITESAIAPAAAAAATAARTPAASGQLHSHWHPHPTAAAGALSHAERLAAPGSLDMPLRNHTDSTALRPGHPWSAHPGAPAAPRGPAQAQAQAPSPQRAGGGCGDGSPGPNSRADRSGRSPDGRPTSEPEHNPLQPSRSLRSNRSLRHRYHARLLLADDQAQPLPRAGGAAAAAAAATGAGGGGGGAGGGIDLLLVSREVTVGEATGAGVEAESCGGLATPFADEVAAAVALDPRVQQHRLHHPLVASRGGGGSAGGAPPPLPAALMPISELAPTQWVPMLGSGLSAPPAPPLDAGQPRRYGAQAQPQQQEQQQQLQLKQQRPQQPPHQQQQQQSPPAPQRAAAGGGPRASRGPGRGPPARSPSWNAGAPGVHPAPGRVCERPLELRLCRAAAELLEGVSDLRPLRTGRGGEAEAEAVEEVPPQRQQRQPWQVGGGPWQRLGHAAPAGGSAAGGGDGGSSGALSSGGCRSVVLQGRWQGSPVVVKLVAGAAVEARSAALGAALTAAAAPHASLVRVYGMRLLPAAAAASLPAGPDSPSRGPGRHGSPLAGAQGAQAAAGAGAGPRAWAWAAAVEGALAELRLQKGEGVLAVLMEHCATGSLQPLARASAYSPFRPNRAWPAYLARRALLHTASEVASALAALHGHGLAHGALRPANVLLLPSPADKRNFRAKVSDVCLSASVIQASLRAAPPPDADAGAAYQTLLVSQLLSQDRPGSDLVPPPGLGGGGGGLTAAVGAALAAAAAATLSPAAAPSSAWAVPRAADHLQRSPQRLSLAASPGTLAAAHPAAATLPAPLHRAAAPEPSPMLLPVSLDDDGSVSLSIPLCLATEGTGGDAAATTSVLLPPPLPLPLTAEELLFVAPEAQRQPWRQASSAADVFSFGVLLWALATGQAPELQLQESSRGAGPVWSRSTVAVRT